MYWENREDMREGKGEESGRPCVGGYEHAVCTQVEEVGLAGDEEEGVVGEGD